MVECLPGHMNVVQEHPFNLSKTLTPVKVSSDTDIHKGNGWSGSWLCSPPEPHLLTA